MLSDGAARICWRLRPVTGFIALLPIILAWLIPRIVIRSVKVQGTSMQPTLQHGRRLVVNLLAYRSGRQPHAGDIVLLSDPRDQSRLGLKRVIGLPGQTVAVRRKKVFIGGHPLQEPYVASPPKYRWGPSVIPPDHYFVLGDNRNVSHDSHLWGPLPRRSIAGKVLSSYWTPRRRR